MSQYSFDKVKEAIVFYTQEVLPTKSEDLDKEIRFLVDNANESGEQIRHYIGFEISGKIHLGTGMTTAIKIKKLQDVGIKCTIWFANYHTWLNEKLDGKMSTILKVKEDYFKPVFIQCCKAMGCNTDEIDFLDAEKMYDISKYQSTSGYQYWDFMMNVNKKLTLSRVQKSISITGKNEGEGVQFAILNYPPMQVADCFFFQAHIVHAGMDQRKCHVLMREVAYSLDDEFALKINNKKVKPIAVHHKLLLSLGVDAKSVAKKMNFTTNNSNTDVDVDTNEDLKMSKSKPNSAIWVHDSTSEIERKIKLAYCPMIDKNLTDKENSEAQKFNPILNWYENLIFPAGMVAKLNRPEKFGGNKEYSNYSDLLTDYLKGDIHPMDLKSAIISNLNDLLKPINAYAENIKEEILYVESLLK